LGTPVAVSRRWLRKLAELTGLPLYSVDMIQYPTGDAKIPHDEYRRIHSELLGGEAWIIDGFGCRESAWERFAVADTLVYLDLPLLTHLAWITKRFLSGLFNTPEGWPEGSPMISSTISSYRVLWLCHRHLTPKYRELVAMEKRARVHHLRSASEIESFISEVRREAQGT
jgi:adenylate kinase family enzyme